MATLYDALIGDLSEKDYLSTNPYYLSGYGVGQMQLPKPTSNAEAIWGPVLQGALGGALRGYGQYNANQSAFTDIANNPLMKSLTQNIGPVASGDAYGQMIDPEIQAYAKGEMPDNFTIKQGKNDLILAAIQKEIADKENLKKIEVQQELNNNLAKEGLILTDKGVVPIPGFAEATGKIEKAKAQGKAEGETGGEVSLGDLPTAVQTKITQAQSLTSEVAALADEFRALNQPAVFYQPASLVSGSKANDLTSKMRLMLPNVIRLAGEVGNLAEQEQARALAATLGNWTSGTEGIANRLDEAADLQRRLALKQVEAAKSGYAKGGLNNLITSLSTPASTESGGAPTPPAGYELTGKKDANGNWGIRRIKQ